MRTELSAMNFRAGAVKAEYTGLMALTTASYKAISQCYFCALRILRQFSNSGCLSGMHQKLSLESCSGVST